MRPAFNRTQSHNAMRKTAKSTKTVPTTIILQTFVAGYKHTLWNNRDEIKQGTVLALEFEKTNPYDGRALMLKHKGIKLGYLPREDRGDIKSYAPVWNAINRGIPVRVVVVNHFQNTDPWYAIAIKCEVPENTMPALAPNQVPTF